MQQAGFGRRGRQEAPAPAPAFGRQRAAEAAPSLPSMADLMRGASGGEDGAAPQGSAGGARAGGGAGEVDMMRAIGSNWPKYRDLWLTMRHSGGWAPSFSFGALFFGGVWLLYRRQWGWFFAVMILQIAISFVDLKSAWLSSLAIQGALGIFGKSLVLRAAMNRVDGIRSMGLSADDTARRIEKSGGVSWAAPVLVGGVIFIGSILIGVAAGVKAARDLRQHAEAAPIVSTQA